MKLAFLFFLKIFIFMTLAYGGTQVLMYSFLGNGDPRFSQAFITGTAFGLMMGLVLTYKQMRELKKLRGNQLTKEDLSVQQVAHFQSPLTKAQILEKLQTYYPAKDWDLKEEAGLIKLKTTYNWKSFGEKIQIKVNQLQNGFSEVLVESKPRGWFTLADYGKNLENILFLRNLLSA